MAAKKTNWRRIYTWGLPLIVLAIFITANLIVAHLDSRFQLSPDLSGGLYTIGAETEALLAELREEVTVLALDEETAFQNGSRTGPVNELLKQYRQAAGGRLTVKYVKVSANPGLLANYQGNIQSGGLIIQSGDRYEVLTLHDMFVTEADYATLSYRTVGFQAEQQLTNAIARVAVAEQKQIRLITGHGETYAEALVNQLQLGGFAVAELNLTAAEIPADSDLLLINQPQRDFSAAELTKLEHYQNQFGNAIVMLAAGQDGMPNLEHYLAEWGVTFEKNILADQNRSLGSVLTIAPLLVVDESNENLSQYKDRFLLTPGARSISLLWESKGRRYVRPVLQTSDSAYAKSYDNETGLITTTEPEAGDQNGPFYVGVIAEIYDIQEAAPQRGQTLFLSSPAMFQEELLTVDNLLNGEYLVEMANYLTQAEAHVYQIAAKSMASSGLAVVGVANSVLFFAIVLLPALLAAVISLVVWGRRRRV